MTWGKFAIVSFYEVWQQSRFLRQNIALRDPLYDAKWQVLVKMSYLPLISNF